MKVLTNAGKTVVESRREKKAQEFLELVKGGMGVTKAAREVGTTLTQLRKGGTLAKVCRETIERAEQEGLLNDKVKKKLTEARLIELMMQDGEKKVALGAAQEIRRGMGIGVGHGPMVGVQVNVVKDRAVVEALKSLQIDVEGEEAGHGEGSQGEQNGDAGGTGIGLIPGDVGAEERGDGDGQ